MKKWIITASVAALTVLFSCDNDDKLNGIITVESEFETTVESWQGGFAEYDTIATDSALALTFDRARLPGILDSTRYGLKAESNNHSTAMFMFAKKRVTGLRPGASYNVTFDMTIGTQYTDKAAVPTSANNTYIKAGASIAEPIVALQGGKYLISINKGNLAGGGTEMANLGNISNGLDANGYRLVTRNNGNNPVRVTANSAGEIWLCVGTDSGYKGLTTIFYERIKAELTLQN